MAPAVASRVAAFRALHSAGCFVLPNPWDAGSARFLASIGYPALATSSAGLAFSLGRPDTPTALSREEVLQNVRDVVEATDLPVNADLQSGYGATPAEVADSVRLCVEAGAAGLSIEDATGDPRAPLFELPEAVARLRAAREAIDATGAGVVLTARAECFLVGHPDPLPASIVRLLAYAEAGAECLYAPGLRTAEEVRAVVDAVAPLPVNVLAAAPGWMTRESLGALGVRRVSVGSAFARVAWTAFMDAAREVAETGAFLPLTRATPFATFATLFAREA